MRDDPSKAEGRPPQCGGMHSPSLTAHSPGSASLVIVNTTVRPSSYKIRPRVTWLRRTVAAARLRSIRWRPLYSYLATVTLTERRGDLPRHGINWWRRLRLQAVRVYEARFGRVPPVLHLRRLPQRAVRSLYSTKDWPKWGRLLYSRDEG
jgi:hypothetical protein